MTLCITGFKEACQDGRDGKFCVPSKLRVSRLWQSEAFAFSGRSYEHRPLRAALWQTPTHETHTYPPGTAPCHSVLKVLFPGASSFACAALTFPRGENSSIQDPAPQLKDVRQGQSLRRPLPEVIDGLRQRLRRFDGTLSALAAVTGEGRRVLRWKSQKSRSFRASR